MKFFDMFDDNVISIRDKTITERHYNHLDFEFEYQDSDEPRLRVIDARDTHVQFSFSGDLHPEGNYDASWTVEKIVIGDLRYETLSIDIEHEMRAKGNSLGGDIHIEKTFDTMMDSLATAERITGIVIRITTGTPSADSRQWKYRIEYVME